jgi:L-histidine N-alpha-methyltransferase
MDQEFRKEVLAGLRAEPKQLSSKYFYDADGDRLFQQIMELEEYYLTRCELEIFQLHASDLGNAFSVANSCFDVIELGAGDGLKTKVLLRELLNANSNFRYVPIDISEHALRGLQSSLKKELPELTVSPVQGDYLTALGKLPEPAAQRRVVLFLGSNIGNLNHEIAQDFLSQLRAKLQPGDMLLIGFDLQKDPKQILAAYNDSKGVTSNFNLNLLTRINRELNADFEVESFKHFPLYEPSTGEARSYLLSTRAQTVKIDGEQIGFNAWEPIHTEISRKYTREQIEKMATDAGCKIVRHFTDSKGWFIDSLWECE